MRQQIEYMKKNYHGLARVCIHTLSGYTKAPKICIWNYECRHCFFDQWLDNMDADNKALSSGNKIANA